MRPTRRNIKRASYAPSKNSEFLNLAIAQQRIDNRNAAATQSGEVRRPVLGRSNAVTQELRKNAAACVIQSELRVRNGIELLDILRSDVDEVNTAIRTKGASEERSNNLSSLSDNISLVKHVTEVQKERRHAAAMVMPKEVGPLRELESLVSLRPDSDLVILGHGAPGRPFLGGTGGHRVSLNHMASDMFLGGVSPFQQNVRMTACSSADAQLRTSFDVTSAGAGRAENTSSDNLNPSQVASAKLLANAMKVEGFQHATVTGYQGVGLTHPSSSVEERQIGTDETSRVPASTVEHIFEAD